MNHALRARLDQMKALHDDLLSQLAEAAGDHQKYAELGKRLAEVSEPVRMLAEWEVASREAAESGDLLRETKDGDEIEFYSSTLDSSTKLRDALERRLEAWLTPKDARDERPLIVEIRAGAGGDEASLWAGDLLRMYQRYAERQGWRVEVLDASESPMGGIKEVVFETTGKGAFSKLRWESGVHRVQRVPVTESSGRIHTSTATVAVLPEAEAVEVDVADDDLRIDTYRASGPGGQHVNTTDSAIRITHLPTNIVVQCQSERSQRQNRDRAMRILMAKLKERAEAEAQAQVASQRKSQVGTGERAEKIRTYNFPENRITDHRIGLKVHGIGRVLEGEIDDIIDALGRNPPDGEP